MDVLEEATGISSLWVTYREKEREMPLQKWGSSFQLLPGGERANQPWHSGGSEPFLQWRRGKARRLWVNSSSSILKCQFQNVCLMEAFLLTGMGLHTAVLWECMFCQDNSSTVPLQTGNLSVQIVNNTFIIFPASDSEKTMASHFTQ